jgi:hypothetical protein
MIIEKYIAAVRFVHTGQDIEKSGFAGAIGADDTDNFTCFNIQAELVQRDQPLKALCKHIY